MSRIWPDKSLVKVSIILPFNIRTGACCAVRIVASGRFSVVLEIFPWRTALWALVYKTESGKMRLMRATNSIYIDCTDVHMLTWREQISEMKFDEQVYWKIFRCSIELPWLWTILMNYWKWWSHWVCSPNWSKVMRNLIIASNSGNFFRKKNPIIWKKFGIGSERADLILKQQLFEAEKKWCSVTFHSAIVLPDAEYPFRLKNCEDAPVILLFTRNTLLNTPHCVDCRDKDLSRAMAKKWRKIIEGLVKYRTLIIEMAYGVDIAAHKAALKNDFQLLPTAHSLDRIYPSAQIDCGKNGCRRRITREYLSGNCSPTEKFRPQTVLWRYDRCNHCYHRISDSWRTFDYGRTCQSYNRDVFALPGRITDTYSRRDYPPRFENKAILVESVQDIARGFGSDLEEERKKRSPQSSWICLLNWMKE